MLTLDPWLRQNLACPRDFKPLRAEETTLVCPEGHAFPVIEGVPVLLLKEAVPTQRKFWEILEQPSASLASHSGRKEMPAQNGLDPFVQQAIPATCGNLYRGINPPRDYPIPELPLSLGEGRHLLDLGCNWGRWCVGAARQGYVPIGIDPNLEAVLAAHRVCRQLNASAQFLVADARHLPFANGCFDVAFSYSVLQHFEKTDVHLVLKEIARVLKRSGTSLIEMPNSFGPHNFLHQLKRGFGRARDFEVRYWAPAELKRVFNACIGPTSLLADGYFSLNPQSTDLGILPWGHRLVIQSSEFLRRLSLRWPWITYGADSLYVRSVLKTPLKTC